MKVVINGNDFSINSVACLSRDKQTGVYVLQAQDENFAKFSQDAVKGKMYFNVEIMSENRPVLVGEDCSIKPLDVLNKTYKLIVNWVEYSVIEC